MSRRDGTMVYAVSRAELEKHLLARQEYHTRRSEALMAEAELEDRKAVEQLDVADSVSSRMDIKSSSNYANIVGQRDQLRSRARAHLKQVAFFKWAATHVPPDVESFDLTRHALSDLEFFPD